MKDPYVRHQERELAQVTKSSISAKAYERFAKRGYKHGHDLEDWLAAEAALLKEIGNGNRVQLQNR